jgi:2-polyprenyl-6-hydroxyphenyl methylase/3-demethylubiquinone-9 3-methyltransferase
LEAKSQHRPPVNNEIYESLGARWYDANDDPVALLRAEAKLRNPWVAQQIAAAFGAGARRVLDVGCGAGFLANYLAHQGHRVTGIDVAPSTLEVARAHDHTHSARYEIGDARALPYEDHAFDVVCAMDFLEHVDDPARVIAEIGRVLAPSGLFLFHTFNRNLLAWLIVIKGVEWFVRNTPEDMHVLHLFLKPSEIWAMCRAQDMTPVTLIGSRPRIGSAFFRMLRSGVVPEDFSFTHTRSTLIAYTGAARKRDARAAQ